MNPAPKSNAPVQSIWKNKNQPELSLDFSTQQQSRNSKSKSNNTINSLNLSKMLYESEQQRVCDKYININEDETENQQR